jgi:epoxyqueuosine reductase
LDVISELKENLEENGASLVGFADLSVIDPRIKKNFTVGISIALALDPIVIKGIIDGPTLEYYREYKRANAKLDYLSESISSFLHKRGYNTDHWGATEDREFGHYMTELPHKTVATLSGLGWIGKCALLVTNEYGSALRLTTVLTDIEEQIEDKSVKESYCKECSICVDVCPGKAPKGHNWHRGLTREDLFDPDLCCTNAKKLAKERTGIEYSFCGICIANCPYTKKYVNKKTTSRYSED